MHHFLCIFMIFTNGKISFLAELISSRIILELQIQSSKKWHEDCLDLLHKLINSEFYVENSLCCIFPLCIVHQTVFGSMYHLEIPVSKMFWNVLKILTLALLEFWYFESEGVKILNIENIEYKKSTDFTLLVLFSKKKLSELSIILPSQFIGNSY